MAQKTAVEWLVEQLTAIGQLQVSQGSNAVTSIIDEAKEMEKEQIMEAYKADCDTYGHTNSFNVAADQYYNLTFNPNQNASN